MKKKMGRLETGRRESAVSKLLSWIENYYVGAGVENPEEVRKKTDAGNAPSKIYLLTAAANPANVMELISADSLRKKVLYESCPLIIGMAGGKQEAMDLAVQILQECQEKMGDFRVEKYVKNR